MFLGYKINRRHNFLLKLLGTKREEDVSYYNANVLMTAVTSCLFLFCILEVSCYFLYNKKVEKLNYIIIVCKADLYILMLLVSEFTLFKI